MHQYSNSGFLGLLLMVTTTLLSACGGDSAGVPTPIAITPITTETTILSFTTVGTSASVNGVVPINAGVKNGDFSIEWDITSSEPYRTEIFLSSDTVLNSAIDIVIYNRNCGADPRVYTCNQQGLFNCRFNNSNEMSCGIVTAFNTAKDLTVFLDAIPKSAYLIIDACNALRDSCKTASVAIELQ